MIGIKVQKKYTYQPFILQLQLWSYTHIRVKKVVDLLILFLNTHITLGILTSQVEETQQSEHLGKIV